MLCDVEIGEFSKRQRVVCCALKRPRKILKVALAQTSEDVKLDVPVACYYRAPLSLRMSIDCFYTVV
jgi:hypothetical protein